MTNEGCQSYPCPVCGYLVFKEQPGSYDVCPICYWEDDIVQLAFPNLKGGANTPSLLECQANFRRFGVCESRFADHVRQPEAGDRRDPTWRPLDRSRDPMLDWESPDDHARWKHCAHDACLYWWREEYWLARRPEPS